jgi:hypothetical protein
MRAYLNLTGRVVTHQVCAGIASSPRREGPGDEASAGIMWYFATERIFSLTFNTQCHNNNSFLDHRRSVKDCDSAINHAT